MFAQLGQLLGLAADPSTPADPQARVRLATAALMIEAARMDGRLDAAEQDAIHGLLRERFALGDAEADALVDAAGAAAADSAGWQGFTRTLVDGLDPDERVGIVEMMWEVAYADGVLHDLEASLMRRLGGLLYVGERDRGEARKRVLRRLGLDH
ncbi:MAG: TerB family tellurite resistance protein [Geminicoccaceae bacterium]|nr:TerB family tellurite resistance protein [Geminicoccaceae bacterium]